MKLLHLNHIFRKGVSHTVTYWSTMASERQPAAVQPNFRKTTVWCNNRMCEIKNQQNNRLIINNYHLTFFHNICHFSLILRLSIHASRHLLNRSLLSWHLLALSCILGFLHGKHIGLLINEGWNQTNSGGRMPIQAVRRGGIFCNSVLLNTQYDK